MGILINIILVILMGVILLLSIPVRLRLNGQVSLSNTSIKGCFICFLGYKNRGIGINVYPDQRISIGSYEKPMFTFSMKGREKEKPSKVKKRQIKSTFTKLKRAPVMKMMKTLFRSIRWEECSISGKLGLNNPMQTGIVFGWLQGFKNIFRTEKCNINLDPVFEPKLETDLNGTIHVRFSPMKTAFQTGFTYLKYHK